MLESLRHDALTSAYMPKMAERFRSGLVLARHYAGANCSHLGVFTLLYARAAMHYETSVAAVEPQACVSFRRAGYECSFLTSGTIDYERMNEFLRRPAFDRVEVYNQHDDWPADDCVALRRARQILASERPQFLVLFLMSTHFPFRYPAAYERHGPVLPAERMLLAIPSQKREALNRYRNSAAFLDDELAELFSSLDPKKHLLVLTGDHGESIFDDGGLTHWNKLSEIQMRTPLAMAGPGVPAQRIDTATTHADLLPTLLHALSRRPVALRHSNGRDQLAGPWPDQAWICTRYPSSAGWEGMLIRGDQRLGVEFRLQPPSVKVRGMLDDRGHFNPRLRPTLDEAAVWATALQREW